MTCLSSHDCCGIAFVEDLDFWAVPHAFLEPCCLKRFTETRDQLDWEAEGAPADAEKEVFPDGALGRLQQTLWDLFEKPHTSLGARLLGIISLLCIILSTVVLTLNTLPYFQNEEKQIIGDFWIFSIIEMVYMTWFTIEFIVRLVTCPDKLAFVRRLMNWIDLLAIIPYFVTIALYFIELDESLHSRADNANDVRRIAQFFRLLRIVKTLRIIRIFKLAKHSTGLQALGHTVRANYKELGLLILFLGMGAIMFSSLVYVFENDVENTMFKTMLDAYWWAIITMTTVGYGDVFPATFMGKIIGCLCAVFGVLVIGLPIPIVGSSFNRFYSREKRREKLMADELQQQQQHQHVDRSRRLASISASLQTK